MTNDVMTADRAREILDAFFGPCDECDGAGHYLCPNCGDDPGESCDEEHDGARHVTCDECDGRGYVRDSDVGDPSDDDTHAQLASVVALHAQLAQVTAERDALHAQLAQVTAERDALRAIVEGRTTPPSDEEARAHIDAGGVFRMVCGTRVFTAESMIAVDIAIEDFPGGRWWALDAQKRPCAWPVVGEVQR